MAETDDVLRSLASLPTLANPRVSPDGDEIAMYYDITGRNELHLLDPETGELSQLSDGNVPRSTRGGFEWGTDGDRLFYELDEGGNEQHDIHVMDRSGETELLVGRDGQLSLGGVGEEIALFASNHEGQMNAYRCDLDGGDVTKLTDYDRAVSGVELSPDGERFAFATNETDDYDNYDVYVAAIDGSDARNLDVGEVGAEASPVDWGPDGQQLLVTDNTTDLTRSGVYDLATDEITWFGGEGYDETPSHFLPDGERFVVRRVDGASIVPVVYDIDSGEDRSLELTDGVAVLESEPLADGRQLAVRQTATRRAELVAYDLETDTTDLVFEAEYGPFDPSEFVEPESISFTSDGVPDTPAAAVDHDPYEEYTIEGLLFDSGRRPSPLIVNPHGGPRAQNYRAFNYQTQFLLSRGFSVLQVNYRGSTGRGREFVEEIYDDWGGAEQGDIAVGVEHVLAEYDWLDEERVVVYGGSYGGYSTNWQLVQYPELYTAGVTWVGVSDLVDMYENTMPHYRTELMVKNLGELDENRALYEERSPVTHAENVDAPLLIAHGVNDPRVPVSQARLLRDALEAVGLEEGTDFEYEELGEEGHGSSDIDQKIRSLELLDEFIDRRVGTEPATLAASDD